MTSKGRIPSLDGLRAISVLLVVFSHSFPTVKHYIDLGNLGVRMFFIISSYLITGILYRDVIKNRFSLKMFYFKRIMRTFPAFYFFLGGLLLVLLSFGLFDWEQFWRAPIYLENYHPRNLWNQKQWFVGHSWSLAVEEQFYLLIAGLFYLFHKKTISKKGVIRFFIGIIILVPLIRIGYFRLDFIPEVLTGSMHRSFETVCDALAVGALGFLMKEKALSFSRKYFTWYYLLSVAVLVFILGALNASEIREIFGYTPRYLYNSIGIFVIHLGMLFILLFVMELPNSNMFARFLNLRVVSYIGLLSYSIYLWQQLWLYNWPIPLAMKYVGILVSAMVSYYLVEEKFLKMRNKMLAKT